MKSRYYFLVLSFMIFGSVYSQNQAEKSSKSSWYLSRVNYSFARVYIFKDYKPTLSYFEQASQNKEAKDYFNFGTNAARGYENYSFSNESNSIDFGGVEFTFKKKTNRKYSIFNLFEVTSGIGFAQHLIGLNIFADSSASDYSAYYDFSTNYFAYNEIAQLNIGMNIQTPHLGNFIALFAGVKGQLGYIYNSYTSLGQIEIEKYSRGNGADYTYYSSWGLQFAKPKLNTAILFPVGWSLKFSESVSLKFSGFYSYNSYLFASKAVNSKFFGGDFTISINAQNFPRRLKTKKFKNIFPFYIRLI
jgi:hypothetical protein